MAVDVNMVLTEILQAEPIVLQLIGAVKTIWTSANPGKTDADFSAFLAAASNKTVVDADVDLTALGLVRDPVTGVWSKPAA